MVFINVLIIISDIVDFTLYVFSFSSSCSISNSFNSINIRYVTEVRRLSLPQNQTESVYQGFRELEESLLSPFPFERL